jgi:hypothetical protein
MSIFLALLTLTAAAPAQAPTTVARWTRFAASFESTKERKNPLQEVELQVDFRAPDGQVTTVDGFWDGGLTYRVRFAPGKEGAWTYATRCSDAADAGLHGKTGAFQVTAYKGKNPLYAHGPLRRSQDRTHLVHDDGTPFLWLADTAWGGPLMSDDKEWDTFLRDRAQKRFNVVQVMGTQNIAAAGDRTGRQAFFDREKIGVEPAFWQRLDRRFDAANDAGLVMAPSFSWAAAWAPAGKALDPGHFLPEGELVRLHRYAQARYGGHSIVWLFGGDIDYSPEADKWRRVGRKVFGDKPRHLVTMHPAPRKLHLADFKDEPWLGFLGYQSSHSNNEKTHRWMLTGEPAVAWKGTPRFPIINIEPNYEAHRDGHTKQPMSAFDVRRAAWWSVLVSPTAGVTYGAHGIWSWEAAPNLPMSHPMTGVAQAWSTALKLPGSVHMKVLVDVLSQKGRRWWTLRPAPALVTQPADVASWTTVARSENGDQGGRLLVAYLPAGGPVELDLTGVAGKASWIDPTNGRATAAALKLGGKVSAQPPAKNAGGDRDYVLVVE